MKTSTISSQRTAPSTYKMTGDRKQIQILKAGLQALFAILLLEVSLTPFFGKPQGLVYLTQLCVVVLFIRAGVAYFSTRWTYLHFSPEGIKYSNLTYSIWTSWENIQCVGLASQSDVDRQREESLIFYQPVHYQRSWWALGTGTQTKAICLTEFGTWRYTALGAELKIYAPQLFNAEAAQSDRVGPVAVHIG